MFSGKTTALIREYMEWKSIGKIPLCINFSSDNRYGLVQEKKMYNHNLLFAECIYVNELKEVSQDTIQKYDVILINEGQFFIDLVEYAKLWCETYGKNIVVSGLDGDYKRDTFGEILKLVPLADSVKKIHAFCAKCANGTPAWFTHRKSKDTKQISIGGADIYEALCRKCYLELETINRLT